MMTCRSQGGRESEFDVLIVGAGINGCATARQLAADGYRALLVDRSDFASGATSRSGRTLHCGLQILAPTHSVMSYLRHPQDLFMRLRAARRAALDYCEFAKDATIALEPMRLAVPVFRGASYKGWHVDIGAKLIGLFTGGTMTFGYRRSNVADCDNSFIREMQCESVIESVVHFTDYRFEWPERIAIDAALEAERLGARIANYAAVETLECRHSGAWLAGIRDLNSNRMFQVQASVVLNFAGVSVDKIIAQANPKRAPTSTVVPVKGVYIAVRLPPEFKGQGFASLNKLKEPFTCLPWADLHYIGPTETVVSSTSEDTRPEEAEVAFLIDTFNEFFPGLKLKRHDVVIAWSGLRAITAAPGYPKGKRLPFNVLLDMRNAGLPNMFTLAWGIIANHRSTARKTASKIARRIPASHQVIDAHRTGLAGGRHRSPSCELAETAIRHCIDKEHARDIRGVLFARTGVAWTAACSDETIAAVAKLLADALDWDDLRRVQEIQNFKQYLREHHLVKLRE